MVGRWHLNVTDVDHAMQGERSAVTAHGHTEGSELIGDSSTFFISDRNHGYPIPDLFQVRIAASIGLAGKLSLSDPLSTAHRLCLEAYPAVSSPSPASIVMAKKKSKQVCDFIGPTARI